MKEKIITVTLNPSIDKTILVEKLNPYELNRSISTRLDPGGKGINVARALKNFGVDVLATGLIAGSNGKKLLNELNQAGVSVDFYSIEGETRTNIKILDQSNQEVTEINEPGFFVSESDLNGFRKKFKALLKKTDIVILSGSLPPGVPSTFYFECVQLAKESGKKVVLDADGDAFVEGVQASPFAIKPNLQELGLVMDKKLSDLHEIVEAVRLFLDKGIEIVIVSMGSDGAVIGKEQEIYKVDAWDIAVQGATGSGDSMVAALAYSLLKNNSLVDIAKLTTAAGTITASKAGTQVCTLDEVEKSLNCVELRRIS
jgi:1-phosphofructokinase